MFSKVLVAFGLATLGLVHAAPSVQVSCSVNLDPAAPVEVMHLQVAPAEAGLLRGGVRGHAGPCCCGTTCEVLAIPRVLLLRRGRIRSRIFVRRAPEKMLNEKRKTWRCICTGVCAYGPWFMNQIYQHQSPTSAVHWLGIYFSPMSSLVVEPLPPTKWPLNAIGA
ncbi:hypothetical protein C8J57DRAFT_1228217 [Mycena rebaudengoi]|nr:hypothetical protein C8J57DRAFT_1228217 [Mycena rebaudengoi]